MKLNILPKNMVKTAALAVLFAALCRSPYSEGSPRKTALRCWRCGEVFTAPVEQADPSCPSCRAICRRTGFAGRCRLYCFDEDDGGCSFLINCPDGSAVLFAGEGGEGGRDLAEELESLGVTALDTLIGAEATERCLETVTAVMKRIPVREIIDPGFINSGARYADFLNLLREQKISYRVVRAVENFSRGSVRFYVSKSPPFGGYDLSPPLLTLCVVHGGNSFTLSRGLEGNGAPSPLHRKNNHSGPGYIIEGSGATLRASAPHRPGGQPLLLESDGMAIGVRSLRRITIAPPARGEEQARRASGKKKRKSTSSPDSATTVININTAPAAELEALSGIGIKRAATIVSFRDAHGPFRTIEEIKKVPGIGEKLFQRNREMMCVE